MTIQARHYTNEGGACAIRDKKGIQEQKNIKILKTKWPKAIFDHRTRVNEVNLRWKKENNVKDDEDDDDAEPGKAMKAMKAPGGNRVISKKELTKKVAKAVTKKEVVKAMKAVIKAVKKPVNKKPTTSSKAND